MGDVGLAAREQQGRHRRRHPLEARLLLGAPVDAGVGLLDEAMQRVEDGATSRSLVRRTARVSDELAQRRSRAHRRLDDRPAGDLTTDRPAHTVRHEVHAELVVDKEVVLIVIPGPPRVGHRPG